MNISLHRRTRRTTRIGAGLGAVASLVALAAPAFAAGPYVVTAGGTSSGTTALSGTAGTVTFRAPNSTVTCSGSTASGTVQLGSSADGVGIATIEKTSFTGCTGALGTRFAITQTSPWRLNATGTPTGGVTAGTVDEVAASVRSTAGPSCSFTVAGSVDGSFDEGAQRLSLTAPTNGADLRIANVSGCFGLVSNGQSATMSTSYDVTSDAGPLAIAAG